MTIRTTLPTALAMAIMLISFSPGMAEFDNGGDDRLAPELADHAAPFQAASGEPDYAYILLADADTSASASFKLVAEIDGVEFVDSDDFTGFHVRGTIDADDFKRAWLLIGAGREPSTWTYVGQKQKYPVRDGVLSKIALSEFDGSDIWQVVIKVEHKNGVVRSDTYSIKIQ